MSTPHINAKKEDFSDIVIMPGDPLRAKYIADNYLNKVVQVNSVRSMLGFTGFFKNRKISVMSHGMGMPSSSIYVRELITDFGVKKVIRVGTCGAILDAVHLNDIVIAMGACTDSNMNRLRFRNYDFSAIASFNLLSEVVNSAKKMNVPIKIGNFFSTDFFYSDDNNLLSLLKKYNIIGIEMETSGIYSIACEFNVESVSICTVTDHLLKNESLTVKERERSCNRMIEMALNSSL